MHRQALPHEKTTPATAPQLQKQQNQQQKRRRPQDCDDENDVSVQYSGPAMLGLALQAAGIELDWLDGSEWDHEDENDEVESESDDGVEWVGDVCPVTAGGCGKSTK